MQTDNPLHLLDSHTHILRWNCPSSGSSVHTCYPTELQLPQGTTRSASELREAKSIDNANAHTWVLRLQIQQKEPKKVLLLKPTKREVCVCELYLYMFKHHSPDKEIPAQDDCSGQEGSKHKVQVRGLAACAWDRERRRSQCIYQA